MRNRTDKTVAIAFLIQKDVILIWIVIRRLWLVKVRCRKSRNQNYKQARRQRHGIVSALRENQLPPLRLLDETPHHTS